MPTESRTKTVLMTLSLAAFVAVGAACAALFRSDEPKSTRDACAESSGQTKADCETRKDR